MQLLKDFTMLKNDETRLKTQINENLNINIEEKFDYERTINYLSANGYARVSSIRENGEFSVKGDVIDIFPTDFKNPVRINIFGDEIEKFEEFNPKNQKSIQSLFRLIIKPLMSSLSIKANEQLKQILF